MSRSLSYVSNVFNYICNQNVDDIDIRDTCYVSPKQFSRYRVNVFLLCYRFWANEAKYWFPSANLVTIRTKWTYLLIPKMQKRPPYISMIWGMRVNIHWEHRIEVKWVECSGQRPLNINSQSYGFVCPIVWHHSSCNRCDCFIIISHPHDWSASRPAIRRQALTWINEDPIHAILCTYAGLNVVIVYYMRQEYRIKCDYGLWLTADITGINVTVPKYAMS